MALHGCLRCMKYVVFTLNFVVWLAGMAVLGLAIYLRMDVRANHFIRAAYADDVSIYYIICYILIGAGVVVTFIGFLGCCGAFQESRCMLGTFLVFLVMVFAAEVAGGVWGYVHRKDLEESVTATFKRLVKEEYRSKDDATHLDQSIDFVQRTLECCGGENGGDYSQSAWEKADDHRLITRVPDSCCIDDTLPNGIESGVCGVGGSWLDGKHPRVWDKGCGPPLVETIQEKLVLMVGVGLGIAGIEVWSLSFSLVLCCGMQRQSAGGYKR